MMGTRAASIAAFVIAVLLAGSTQAEDVTPQSREEIVTLQQRLTDAGCYRSAIDGASSAALDAAVKQCPDMKPFLRIETGMHTAKIWRIAVDAACSRLATASEDKTVRVWSLPEGRLERVIRLPTSDGEGGKVYATALSPDGRLLAAGGWDASAEKSGTASLTVIDLHTGSVRRLGTFAEAISQLAFSGDGQLIAIGLYGHEGVRVIRISSGEELLKDKAYGGPVPGLAFEPDGSLIAASEDGEVRHYLPGFHVLVHVAAPGGKLPFSVAVDAAGKRIAVGFLDNVHISILDAYTLKPLAEADTHDLPAGDLSKVAWSADGSTLLAGGAAWLQFGAAGPKMVLRRFDRNGRRKGADIPAASNTIMDIRPCGDDFAFASQDPRFALLTAEGQVRILQGPRSADMRYKLGDAFALSADAATVRFGLGSGDEKPVLFDLATASLIDSSGFPAGLATARIEGLPVTDWQNNFTPKFRGARIALDDYERSRALARRADARVFALGTNFFVRAFDETAKQLWQRPGPGIACGVSFSGDGEVLAVAYDDGTIRWLRASGVPG